MATRQALQHLNRSISLILNLINPLTPFCKPIRLQINHVFSMSLVRALASVCVKSCKIEKVAHFTHFEQKDTHISGCKIVHLCTITIVTVRICTITVAPLSIFLCFFLSPHPCLARLSLTHSSVPRRRRRRRRRKKQVEIRRRKRKRKSV